MVTEIRPALPWVAWALAWLMSVSAAVPAAASSPSLPGDGRLDFTITRNGEAIGTHSYRFARHGRQTTVDIRTEIDFRLFTIPVYRFQHQSREVWDGDTLASLVSQTDDNGEPVHLEVRAEGEVLTVQRQTETRAVEGPAIPASLWNASTLRHRRLIGTVGGSVLATRVIFLGETDLQVGGRTVATRHYRVSGDFNRELWYDRSNQTLVHVRFEAEDGSQVEYVRQNASL